MGNSNNNTYSAKKSLIIGVVGLVLIIAGAIFLTQRLSKYATGAQQDTLDEISQAKENADKYKEQNAGSASENPESTSDDGSEELQEPILAPDFTVYTEDGTAVKFSDKLGKPVIINFWATWCGPCKNEMPHFEKAYAEYGDKIEFMMINPTDGANDTNESVNNFIYETGYTFPVYRDWDVEASSIYGIRAFPTTILVDADGYFLGGYEGALTEEMLYALVDMLLQ